MFDAIVHLARMSFTHGWLRPVESVRATPDRDTGSCNPDNHGNRAGEDDTAQATTPQRIWFGGCCG